MTANAPSVSTENEGTDTKLCRDLFFEFLEAEGVSYIFGNPGTTELPLIDGCNVHPSVRYVMSLHEDIAVAQAMGYARASGKFGVVNLHVAPGVAHGLGNLYNAYRARVPLLVTAGQHYSGLKIQDPILTADLAALVRPFTKWAYEVTFPDELPIALQRAFKEATTPPFGPVFLSLPMDVMLAEHPGTDSVRVSRVPAPMADSTAIDDAVRVLASAERPMILSGDGVGHANAWAEVAELAERLGATVYSEGYSTLANFPSTHPLYAGPMSNRATQMRQTFDDVDVLLMCGVTSQAPVSRYDDGGPLVPWRVRTVSMDDDPSVIGKNQPVEVGLVGDVQHNLARLNEGLANAGHEAAAVETRTAAVAAHCAERVEAWEKKVAEARAAETLSATLVAAELRDRLPGDAILVDESVSNRPAFVNVLEFGDPLSYYAANGLSLGYSVGAAVGIKLAVPRRQVVNVVGDGSLMYYPHALWNAANTRLPVLFIVLNNGSYQVLKLIVERMGGPWGGSTDMPPGLDLGSPSIDLAALARSFGVEAERVDERAAMGDAIERGLNSDAPYLIDVMLD
jgi:benzoylformate decarboxylase